MKSCSFKEYLNITDEEHDKEPFDENDIRRVRLLKRRLGAFIREETDRKAHLLSNLIIELRNIYQKDSFIRWVEEECGDEQKRQNIMFTFLDEIYEEGISKDYAPCELAIESIDNLKRERLLDT